MSKPDPLAFQAFLLDPSAAKNAGCRESAVHRSEERTRLARSNRRPPLMAFRSLNKSAAGEGANRRTRGRVRSPETDSMHVPQIKVRCLPAFVAAAESSVQPRSQIMQLCVGLPHFGRDVIGGLGHERRIGSAAFGCQ